VKKKYSKSKTTIVESTFTDFEFTCHYPKENPPGAIEDITKLLKHLGVFDDLKP
jgi:hypothetical protein